MAEDVKDLQRKLKELELRSKLEAKHEKQRLKDEKLKMKLKKKQEKMRAKMIKKGQVPPEEGDKPDFIRPRKEKVDTSGKIVQAEVVEFRAKEWERRSVQSMDEVEKKIDRFSGKGVQSLTDRYREKYGEDLQVPELYQIETSIELDGELEKYAKEEELKASEDEWKEPEPPKSRGFFKPKEKPSIEIIEEDESPREPRFMDLSTGALFLRNKHGAHSGGGKRAALAFVDVIVLIVLFPITIIRLITTLYYSMKRRKARKALKKSKESAQFA
jgi:hypothetical protein